MEENSIKTSQNKCEKKDNIVENSFEMVDINNFTLEELEKYIEELGEKKFHAKQIFKWIHKIGVTSFDEMSDISKSLREKLKERAYILNMDIIEVQTSKKDGTKR